MQCKHHPDRAAKQYCASCGIPLCEDCAEEQKTGKYFCFQCAMVQSVSEGGTTLKDKRERSAKKKEKKRWGAFRYFMIVSGILILSMWGYIIFGAPEAPTRGPDFADQPRILLFMVDGAIKRFAHYEKNQYPEKLADLIPKYLTPATADIANLNLLSYQKDTQTGYRLSLRGTKEGQMNIIISPQGIRHESSSGEGG